MANAGASMLRKACTHLLVLLCLTFLPLNCSPAPAPPLQVEKIFRQAAEFCSEHDVWKLNVAHVFFMQQEAKFEAKFKDAIRYYEPAVRGGSGRWLPPPLPLSPRDLRR